MRKDGMKIRCPGTDAASGPGCLRNAGHPELFGKTGTIMGTKGRFCLSKRNLAAAAAVVCFAVFLYLFNQVDRTSLYEKEGRSFEKAQVLEILQDNLQESGQRVGQQTVLLLIRSGKHKGEALEAFSSSSYLYGAECTPGMKVIAIINEDGGELYVTVYSYDRSTALYLIIGLFLMSLWLVGGRQGIHAGIALAFTFIAIIGVFIPMIYRGVSPIAAAVLVAVLVTVLTMYLVGGEATKIWSAIISTSIGVVISGLLAWGFGAVTRISGYNVSDIEQLEYVAQMTDIRIGELLYAGILISALGAIMDVGMSVSSAVHEVSARAPELTWKELYLSGIHVGRDMISTMSNTLVLAFTGSSLNTLVFIYAYEYTGRQVINMYSVGIEIIQGAAATMGVVLTVPVAAFISARLLKRQG